MSDVNFVEKKKKRIFEENATIHRIDISMCVSYREYTCNIDPDVETEFVLPCNMAPCACLLGIECARAPAFAPPAVAAAAVAVAAVPGSRK